MKRFLLLFCCLGVLAGSAAAPQGDLRLGLIGLDTSHCVNWAAILNDPANPNHVKGAKIVAAYKGGSYDVFHSYSRVDGFTQTMVDQWKVELVDTIEELCTKVDAIMLTSGDGRVHLEQARPVILAGLPLFIDKPIANSLTDTLAIFRLAAKHNVPVFSASGRRFAFGDPADRIDARVGEVTGAASVGPASIEPHHQDLFWYGIHPTEALFVFMGDEIEKVSRVHTPGTDLVVGVWSGDRVGTLRGVRPPTNRQYRMTVFGTRGNAEVESIGRGHPDTLEQIVKFFRTGVAPVKPEQTIAIIAFMEAADESKRQHGREVYIRDVMARAMNQLPPDRDPPPAARPAAIGQAR